MVAFERTETLSSTSQVLYEVWRTLWGLLVASPIKNKEIYVSRYAERFKVRFEACVGAQR